MIGDSNYNNLEVDDRRVSLTVGQKFMFFMIGGGLGAALALLFAPKTGSELRSDIAGMAEKGYEETLAAATQLKENGARYFNAAKETGSEVADIVASGAAAVKSEVKSDVDTIGAIVEDSARRAVRAAKSMHVG